MTPRRAHRIVSRMMSYYYRHRSRINRSKLLRREVVEAIRILTEINVLRESGYAIEAGNSVDEWVHVYYEESLDNEEDILSQFHYISDRWNCAGRLLFIGEVIKLIGSGKI